MSNQPIPLDPEADPSIKVSHLAFPVVGLGASAGGLQALGRFFEAMPKQPGMAFVVILHLSPKHESIADQILQRATGMPVLQVTEAVPLEIDHVYVISPRKQLGMSDGGLQLTDLPPARVRHVAIDYFFRTLAEVHRERAIAVVLSGTGTDGSAGISRVREMGGLTFAQSPSDAEYDGMPQAAIATGAIDFVLPVTEMADRMLALGDNARQMALPHAAELGPMVHNVPEPSERLQAADAMNDILAILRSQTGHDFRYYKRATVLRRIERRMQVNGVSNLPAYRTLLEQTPAEYPALLKDMLISVTNFFRDREAFDALEREVLPAIFAARTAGNSVRVWAAGCATGEEAYSLAMLLCEQAEQLTSPPALQVFATDIDEDAIARARTGVYPPSIMADLAPSRVTRYFVSESDHYRVRKSVRQTVLFSRHNVLQDPPFSQLDLISCRNLLIYLERAAQKKVLETFHFALHPGGYLFLGSAEAVDTLADFFEPVDNKNRLYRAIANRRPRVHASAPSTGPARYTAEIEAPAVLRDRPVAPLAQLHKRVFEQYAPPSVLVNRAGHIVHMSERAAPFLRHVGGAPTLSLLSLALPELQLELRAALYRAIQQNESVDSGRVRIRRDGQLRYVNMTTRPVTEGVNEEDEQFYLVLFTEVEYVPEAAASTSSKDDPVAAQLEEELHRARDQLQRYIQQSEASHEQMSASNEEFQSINEELRSTSEELETSKEELQSVNEELITVNYELKSKVDEAGRVNNDLQNLIASTDIATVFIDQGLCIKRYTPRATEIFSIIPADIGRSLLDLTHRLDYPTLGDDALRTFRTLRTTEREIGSSDNKWYLVRMLPYRTTEDSIQGAVLTFIDITRGRLAEELARRNEERLRMVRESALDFAIITMDRDGVITSWSPGAERTFGYTESEAVGQSGALIFTERDRLAGAFKEELRLARDEGRAEDDRWHLRRDGGKVFCSGITRPLLRGGLYGYGKIARDVTDDRRQQKERERLLKAEQEAREAAQAAIQRKDEFLAVMSHELKHPLNLVLMNAELLSRRPDIEQDTNAKRATEAIRRTVLNQAQIIDDLLDLSRLNTGKLNLSLMPVNVSDCIRRITGALAGDLAQRQQELSCTLPPEDVWMSTDPVRLDQIVWNLLNNAMKFTPDGGRISMTLAVTDSTVRLDVVDTGQGIGADALESIFDMFKQANMRTNRRAGGLGIGLALVRQLVELQGGTVKAWSDGPGRGSRFRVCWPLTREAPANDDAPAAAANGVSGRHLLVVDDSIEILEPFAALLEMEGAQVSMFDNAPAALAFAREHGFDVLLSDIGMPGMDGYELIREIRQLPQHAHVPAIALTGFGRPEDGERAREAGFDIHIGKPIVMKNLLETLAELDARPRAG